MTKDTLRIGFNYKPSNYKRKGYQIYRADLCGGSTWAFIFDGQIVLCYSLFAAYERIDALTAGKTYTVDKVNAELKPAAAFKTLEEY